MPAAVAYGWFEVLTLQGSQIAERVDRRESVEREPRGPLAARQRFDGSGRRTQRYADLIEGQEQAVEPDLVDAVRELGDREQKIYKATRDIVVGRNQ